MVIVGFFVIAYRDDDICITIFSISITIILFGITEVLGCKELSALIGGNSGYILGRSSVSEVKKVSE